MIRSLFLAMILSLTVFSSVRECSAGDKLTVVYTGNTRGKLRACNCPGDPYGGLAERVTLIRQLRKQEGPFVLIDSGNMVSLYGDYSRKAEYVIELMNLMGYDAAGIGFNELYRGIEPAARMEEDAAFPLLSASVMEQGGSSPVTTPSVVLKAGDVTVGIIGVSDPESHNAMGRPKVNDYSIAETGAVFDGIISGLEQRCDFIIVLSQLTKEKNAGFLAAHSSVDLLIQSWGNETLDPPLVTPDGIIAAPGRNGQFVGIMELERSPDGGVKMLRHELKPVLDIPEDKKAREIVRDYYMSIE